MGFKGLILVECLLMAVVTAEIIWFTKFVNFLEIEPQLALIVGDAFLTCFGFALVFIVCLKRISDAEQAKRLVSNDC